MELKDFNVVDILQIGVIGLGFLLAVLSYHLLTKEQKQETPRAMIIKSIYVFMFFSVLLSIIGMFSKTERFDNDEKKIGSSLVNSETEIINKEVLYNYFVYSDNEEDFQLCNISEFEFIITKVEADVSYIEGEISGKMLIDDKLVDFNNNAFGFMNKYFLKITHDQGVAFLEHKMGDYVGYWIGEVDDPDVSAVISPLVFSPKSKGLSIKQAKEKWPILNDVCRPLSSLNEIL